jgi:hypothetical protein
MTTYGELQDKIARVIQDPDKEVFVAETLVDITAAAWAEISRIAPQRFTEDIEPVADTLKYPLRDGVYGEDVLVDDIEVQSVEIWDGSTTPARALRFVEPQSAHPMGLSYSQAGWITWGGELNLPNRIVDFIGGHEADYLIRIRGYAPWPPPAISEDDPPTIDADGVIPFSANLEEALVQYCNVEALRRLNNSKSLFTQYQTKTNNTDITQAGLINELSQARDEWRRLARSITVLREAP